MTTNSLVAFLGSYGPQPSSNNLYDEFVVAAAEKTGCDPLEIDQPLIGDLVALFRSETPVSVILTGTAGDGKTYAARKLVEALAEREAMWTNTQKVFDLPLPRRAHRRIRFIKDLSELNDSDKDEIFPSVRDSLLGEGSDLFVICVNDGHLLKFFRDREGDGDGLHQRIADMLREDEQHDPSGNFQLFNMSRQSHEHLVDKIIDEIVLHPGWSACTGCPALASVENRCPIRCNLDILRKTDGASMRARLKDMIRMAAADRQHLSIRLLLLLTVNILLGDRKPGRALLTCRRARSRASSNDYAATNPYANAFGENLGERERKQYGAFAVLSEFGVGFETNNFFDHSLLWGSDELPKCAFYGDRIFGSLRDRYRANPDAHVREFSRDMVDQRRRLFFSIDPDAEENLGSQRRDPWNLSVFKHGASYIRLAAALSSDRPKVPQQIRRALVRALNRMMTGEMTNTDDRIWITEPSGVYRGRKIPLLVQHAGSKAKEPTYASLPKTDGNGKAPVLTIAPLGRTDLCVDLELRPTMVECLLRIGEGALPASFSSECLQDVERFQLHATTAVLEASNSKLPPPQQIAMSAGTLQSRPIDVMDVEDDW